LIGNLRDGSPRLSWHTDLGGLDMKKTLIALTTVALAAGCTSAASTTHGPHGTTAPPSHGTTTPPPPRHPTPHGRTVIVTEKDNGHVVRVHRGETVDLQLSSTYWQVSRVAGNILERVVDATPRVRDYPSCVPGQGCGTVEVEYLAEHAGRVTLKAHRGSCGEAMRCVGNQGRFRVEVVVT
jgi:hypothetical protein